MHGDFWAHNILVSPGRVSVIDWTTLHYGDPLEDLITFAVSAVFRRMENTDRLAEIIWDALFGDSLLSIRLRAAAARKLTQCGIAPDLMRPLFWITLLTRLTRTEFADNSAWYSFAVRYAAAGLPSLAG